MREGGVQELQSGPLQLLHQRVRDGEVRGGVRQLVLLHGEAGPHTGHQPRRDGQVESGRQLEEGEQQDL